MPERIMYVKPGCPYCHAARESRWRATLGPYYREFDIDPASIGAGPGRAPFSAAAADVLDAFRPPVVSFHFGVPAPGMLARVLCPSCCC